MGFAYSNTSIIVWREVQTTPHSVYRFLVVIYGDQEALGRAETLRIIHFSHFNANFASVLR